MVVDHNGSFFAREDDYRPQHGLYMSAGNTSASSIDSIASFASSTDLDALAILNDEDIKGFVAEQLVPIGEKQTIVDSIKHSHSHLRPALNVKNPQGHHHEMMNQYDQQPIEPSNKGEEKMGLVSAASSFKEKVVDLFSAAKTRIMQKDQPVLLPSQKRKLRGWFMKKYKRARKKEAALEEEEEEEEEEEKKPSDKGIIEKIISCFRSERSESRVLYTELSEEDKMKVQSLILDLGYALTLYGISANRTEYHLTLVCTYFGIDAYFNITPVGIWFAFGQKMREAENRTFYVKVETQMLNLDKLSKLDNVAMNIARGRLGVDEARKEIARIVSAPNVYEHPVFHIFMHFICPGLFGLLWSGNVAELLTCLSSGLAIALMQMFFQRFAFYRNVQQIMATVTAGIVGIIMKAIFYGKFEVSVSLVALAATWQFLPGQPMAVACYEIATGALLSGICRFVVSFVVILKLGFGFLITNVIVTNIPHLGESEINPPEREAIPLWFRFIIMIGLALNIVFTRRVPKHAFSIIYITLSTVSAHIVAFYLSSVMHNTEAGTIIGGILIGIMGNIFTLISKKPSIMVVGIGALLLGPGSMSFRGIAAFVFKETTEGLNLLFEIFWVGLALFFGFTVANIVVPIKQNINV
ncbi:DUF1212 domain-containing protein [Naegleria gruberi]|uniref:DUF1212 domain-containing protein n=1 Tax=Naegleria gruberi TaxID=5762 RepID=D2V4X2_NAEGR|nr:DUF1212 domain-containing protein [Naegleria gruberi]EFC48005.1 DUF1212 domain-containing protein [Naegleria gruberi]|eukprot:XP_002680749.1 DUF1212 domain-containing protein [Naegleria gruberi strain NEG-M]